MFTGVAVTLDLSVLAGLMVCSGGMGAVALHGAHSVRRHWSLAREQQRAQQGLADHLRSRDFLREIQNVADRAGQLAAHPRALARAMPSETLLYARLDTMRQVQQIWGAQARKSALDQVAAIMRRSLRGGDRLSGRAGDIVNTIEGDGFTILVRGAQEQDAGAIARRLRGKLARARIDGLSDNIRLTASFGIASRRMGESVTLWRARAAAALHQARSQGEDQIVEATMVEEIKLLPPPVASSETKAA